MSYLETEIDEVLESLCIKNKKLNTDALKALTASLCQKFCRAGCSLLNPTELIAKRTEHNPGFWKEVSQRIHQDRLIFMVFDTAYRAWEIESSRQLERILFETTGYPFWVTDTNFSFLIYMDDHDCVTWA